MNTTPLPRMPKEKPPYSEKIRELRELLTLTQPELASEIGVKRGAIAQWEGGTREPRYKNYRALAAFAEKRGLTSLRDLFSHQIFLTQITRRKNRKDEKRTAYAKRRFLEAKKLADMGDREAGRILKLSRMDRGAYARYLVGTLTREIGRLKDWGFSDLLDKLAKEASDIEELRLGCRSLRKEQGAADVQK